ncbi:MAG: WYL domain-containing protein [Saccharofermentans sp.]|nr:WYL domain-containing protein [Saccharofermentans sp.]
MANSEKSKIKTLLVYDYFLRNSDALADDSNITMPDIIEYLTEITQTEFERKSVYSDIKHINDFMKTTGLLKDPTQDWIIRDGKRYKRDELLNELTMDEARLIVDAINATPFINSGLCEKIKSKHPAYFKNGYKALVSHESAMPSNTKFLLNSIRNCIENREVLSIDYGYIVARGFKGISTKAVSPLALDWERNNYYLIAIDNSVYANNQSLEASVRRYRIDRIKSHKVLVNQEYVGPHNDRDVFLKKYLKSAIDAFSSANSRMITLTLTSPDEKTLLKAYGAFSDSVTIRKIMSDKTEQGEIKFCFEAGLVPTLFNELFKLYTFDGVEVEIHDEEVKQKFKTYLKKALKGL